MAEGKTIGQMNGPWAFSFKIAMLIQPAILFVGGWLLTELRDISNELNTVKMQISAINASRFSAEDGLKVWQAIAELQKDIAVLNVKAKP